MAKALPTNGRTAKADCGRRGLYCSYDDLVLTDVTSRSLRVPTLVTKKRCLCNARWQRGGVDAFGQRLNASGASEVEWCPLNAVECIVSNRRQSCRSSIPRQCQNRGQRLGLCAVCTEQDSTCKLSLRMQAIRQIMEQSARCVWKDGSPCYEHIWDVCGSLFIKFGRKNLVCNASEELHAIAADDTDHGKARSSAKVSAAVGTGTLQYVCDVGQHARYSKLLYIGQHVPLA
ncbi:uncharacterized protein MEPE_03750 [Melanopsichium pennsylvanicum]|uniref:Uncharacterized protein n=1 Tax=Melanopsichium pennsylvanicum TaxID=63383 RepID=A0AAJ4XND7_9BASI|nr:uncharacterized protein MEPE_03750 [Melanopsichium pennsylvanicum]